MKRSSLLVVFLGGLLPLIALAQRAPETLAKMGFVRTMKIGFSYVKSALLPRKEKNLEDFFINRFGRELYLTFFKDYTEKVWGTACSDISAAWGAQRVKGISSARTRRNRWPG